MVQERSVFRSKGFSGSCVTQGWGACRHGGGDPGRRSAIHHLPGQARHRGLAGRNGGGASGGTANHRHDHVRARGRSAQLESPPARDPADCRHVRAGSRSSCRCRSCTWRHPCSSRGARARARLTGKLLLMHALSRLALHPVISNIQVSWVKMGARGCARLPRRGRERPRGYAHEREHSARGGHAARSGDVPASDGRTRQSRGARAGAANDALRARARGSRRRLLSSGASVGARACACRKDVPTADVRRAWYRSTARKRRA